MSSPFSTDFSNEPDLSHRVRRMRTFEDMFMRNLEQMSADHGYAITSDRIKLRSAFLTWLDNFGQTRPFANVDRTDFIRYSAGRMFAELIRHHVIAAGDGDREAFDPARIWPEGYIYASFCLTVAIHVLAQDGDNDSSSVDLIRDQRLWQSFRENAQDNPDIAVAFFDLILGVRPNWLMPQLVERRPAMRGRMTR